MKMKEKFKIIAALIAEARWKGKYTSQEDLESEIYDALLTGYNMKKIKKQEKKKSNDKKKKAHIFTTNRFAASVAH